MSDMPPTIPFDESLEFIAAITIEASDNNAKWWQFMKSHKIPWWHSDSEQLIQNTIELQQYVVSGYMRHYQQQYGPSHKVPADIITIIMRYVVVHLAIVPVPKESIKPSWLPLWKLSRYESLIWATHPRNEFNFYGGLDGDISDNSQLSAYPKGGRFRCKSDVFHEGEVWGHIVPLEGQVNVDNEVDGEDVDMVTID